MAVLAGDALGHCDALFLGLVRQHRSTHRVADGPDVGQAGLAVGVDHDPAAFVELQADRFRIQADGVRHPADRHDQAFDFERPGFALGVSPGDRDPAGSCLDFANRDPELDLQALLEKRLVRFLCNLFVDPAKERGQRLQHGDLGAEPPPDRTHFQADHARADQAQLLRHVLDSQRAVVGQNPVFVERYAGQRTGTGSGGQDDVFRADSFRRGASHTDLVASIGLACEAGAAMEETDLVLLEQKQDAVVVLFDDLVLARQHLADVDREALDLNAVVGEMMAGLVEIFR